MAARATGRASLRNPELRAAVEEDQRVRTRSAALKQARADIRKRANPTVPADPRPAPRSPAPRASRPAPVSRSAPVRGGPSAAPASSTGRALSAGNEVAGFVLGLFLWGWVILPFLKDGVPGVKATLAAKFLNKTPDGKWLD